MKFIHTADVHLGVTPDIGYPWSEKRTKEIWDSFKGIIQAVQNEQVELLLIAGDFFHRQPLVRELKEVNYLFSTIPDTQVVLIAGNHDYLKADSYYTSFPWNENVLGLWDESCQEIYLPKITTWVYGFSYHSREITQPLYQSIRANGKPGFHVLIAHGGDEKHIPIATDQLLTAGFDYIALGHIHRPQQIVEGKIAYCGAPEPLDRNDLGMHGYIMGTFDGNGIRTKFVPSAVRSYIPITIKVDRETTQFSLEEQIKRQIRETGVHNLYQIIIRGLRDPDTVFQAQYIKELGNITEILDDTKPDYDLEKMSLQYGGSLIGAYIEHFMESEDPIEKKALYYGLHAMLEAKR